MFCAPLSKTKFVIYFLLVIAVIDLGHVQGAYAYPGPSGFTRIARDLSRKSQSLPIPDSDAIRRGYP
jgi:hypothetical protein